MNAEQPIACYIGIPQKENGYTPIANELLEAILIRNFPKVHLQIILAIMRMTYGYSKKSDALSGWQIAKMTGIDRSNISKGIDELIEMKVIKKLPIGRYSHGILVNEISINKIYDEWETVGKKPTVGKLTTVVKSTTDTVGKLTTQPLVNQPTHKAIKTNKTIYVEILEYLNLKANKKFKPVKANLDLIKARLTEYSADDLKAVIDSRVTKWLNDPKMNEYLRPGTLFNATKCAQYISEGPASKEVPAWKKGLV